MMSVSLFVSSQMWVFVDQQYSLQNSVVIIICYKMCGMSLQTYNKLMIYPIDLCC